MSPCPLIRTQEEKDVGEKKFMQIATAYETLREDESRAEYDYMLVRGHCPPSCWLSC